MIQMADTSGKICEHANIINEYIRYCDGAIVTYSPDVKNSVNSAVYMIDRIREQKDDLFPILVIENLYSNECDFRQPLIRSMCSRLKYDEKILLKRCNLLTEDKIELHTLFTNFLNLVHKYRLQISELSRKDNSDSEHIRKFCCF